MKDNCGRDFFCKEFDLFPVKGLNEQLKNLVSTLIILMHENIHETMICT